MASTDLTWFSSSSSLDSTFPIWILLFIHEKRSIFKRQIFFVQFCTFFSKTFGSDYYFFLSRLLSSSAGDILCRHIFTDFTFGHSASMIGNHRSSKSSIRIFLDDVSHHLETFRTFLVRFKNRFHAGTGASQMVPKTIFSIKRIEISTTLRREDVSF